jgi:hypothetical protein
VTRARSRPGSDTVPSRSWAPRPNGAPRERVSAYHQSQPAKLPSHAAAAIDRYRAGQTDAHAVDETIHHYHRAAGNLCKSCSARGRGDARRVHRRPARPHDRPRRTYRLARTRPTATRPVSTVRAASVALPPAQPKPSRTVTKSHYVARPRRRYERLRLAESGGVGQRLTGGSVPAMPGAWLTSRRGRPAGEQLRCWWGGLEGGKASLSPRIPA